MVWECEESSDCKNLRHILEVGISKIFMKEVRKCVNSQEEKSLCILSARSKVNRWDKELDLLVSRVGDIS